MKLKFLAANMTIVVALMISPPPTTAGMPVIDGANLGQNILTAIESVAQTRKQIEQYKTELQQYENMLKNTTTPSAYIWDQAQSTINELMAATDTLSYYRNQLGSVDSYLSNFQDVAYYRSLPCFNGTGDCSTVEQAAMAENRRLESESQKKANDAMFKGLDLQQDAMKDDARTLERLQKQAQSATGQMQAIGYANQLASQQSNQLLQIRGLLVAQQNAIATRMQAETDREARQQVSSEALRKGDYSASPSRNW